MHPLPLLPPPPPPLHPLPTHEPSRGDIPRPNSFLIVAGIRQELLRVYLVRLNPVRRQHSTLSARSAVRVRPRQAQAVHASVDR
jgi:hypothetical protein